METDLYGRIISLLTSRGCVFQETRHGPVFTAEVASEVSAHADEEGTKSLALEVGGGGVAVATVSGADRVDFGAVRRLLDVKKVTMCPQELLATRLGTEPGGVAPFGYGPVVTLLVSPTLFTQKHVFFNAGRNDVTIRVSGADFRGLMESEGAIVMSPC